MSSETDLVEIKKDIKLILEKIDRLEKATSGGMFSFVKGAAFIAAIDKITKIEKTVNELRNRR